RAGGRVELGGSVTALHTEGRAVRWLQVAPTPPRSPGASPYAGDRERAGDDVSAVRQADAYVLALPPPAIAGILDPTLRGDHFFAGIARISTKRTTACQLYFDRAVSANGPHGMVVGTPDPYSAVLDRKRLWSAPDGPGSVLVFVGEDDSMPG